MGNNNRVLINKYLLDCKLPSKPWLLITVQFDIVSQRFLTTKPVGFPRIPPLKNLDLASGFLNIYGVIITILRENIFRIRSNIKVEQNRQTLFTQPLRSKLNEKDVTTVTIFQEFGSHLVDVASLSRRFFQFILT